VNYRQFYQRITSSVPVGTVLRNPGGGTTEIKTYTEKNLTYKRGKSNMSVAMRDLYDTYRHFQGTTVSSPDLRRFAPSVFDSKQSGHSCNCTVLFMLLRETGIVARIQGRGIRGSPFQVYIPSHA
jgi:hypothetical protein